MFLNNDNSRDFSGKKEGRLSLAGNLSISLRRINKDKQNGVSEQDLLSEIFRKREFLDHEREDITLKLKQCFENNS